MFQKEALIPAGLVLALVVPLGSLIWWAGSRFTSIDFATKRLDERVSEIEKHDHESLMYTIRDIERRLGELEE